MTYLFVGLMLSFARPESPETQSIAADKMRSMPRKIERGWRTGVADLFR